MKTTKQITMRFMDGPSFSARRKAAKLPKTPVLDALRRIKAAEQQRKDAR